MGDVSIAVGSLPNNMSATLFTVEGLVKITGLTARVLVSADDPYSVGIRIGGVLVASSVNVGGQLAGYVFGGAGTAGPSLASLFAFDGAEIVVESTQDPGSGEVEWFVTYEPLVPNATIVAA